MNKIGENDKLLTLSPIVDGVLRLTGTELHPFYRVYRAKNDKHTSNFMHLDKLSWECRTQGYKLKVELDN